MECCSLHWPSSVAETECRLWHFIGTICMTCSTSDLLFKTAWQFRTRVHRVGFNGEKDGYASQRSPCKRFSDLLFYRRAKAILRTLWNQPSHLLLSPSVDESFHFSGGTLGKNKKIRPCAPRALTLLIDLTAHPRFSFARQIGSWASLTPRTARFVGGSGQHQVQMICCRAKPISSS